MLRLKVWSKTDDLAGLVGEIVAVQLTGLMERVQECLRAGGFSEDDSEEFDDIVVVIEDVGDLLDAELESGVKLRPDNAVLEVQEAGDWWILFVARGEELGTNYVVSKKTLVDAASMGDG
jgi:hypothetical protein